MIATRLDLATPTLEPQPYPPLPWLFAVVLPDGPAYSWAGHGSGAGKVAMHDFSFWSVPGGQEFLFLCQNSRSLGSGAVAENLGENLDTFAITRPWTREKGVRIDGLNDGAVDSG